MLKIIRILVLYSLCYVQISKAEVNRIEDIEKVKHAIVTINSRISLSAYQSGGSWSGTGFIADKKNGFVITNNHVVGKAAAGTYLVTFYNGAQAEAKLIYYDSYIDFAILRINPNEFPSQAIQINFTNAQPKLGQGVFVVGNTEGQGFSFHKGHISDLIDINGEMPQSSYVISMNSAGGSSGSPILDSQNQAIGILYGGGKTHVMALKGSYVNHALTELQHDKAPIRKHMGAICQLYSLDKAVKHQNFPKEEMEKYIKAFPDSRNRVITVKTVLNGSTAQSILFPGDIIWETEGKIIAGDLSILDNAMNKADSNKINLTIFRNGQKLEKEISLYDIEKNKIKRIFDFAGGLFFEADDYVSSKSGIPIGSVAVINVQAGSSFSAIPEMFVHNYKNIYRLAIKSLGNTQIKNLDDIIHLSSDLVKKKYTTIVYQNYQPYFPLFNNGESGFISSHEDLVHDITFDSIDAKPRILRYDNEAKEWVADSL